MSRPIILLTSRPNLFPFLRYKSIKQIASLQHTHTHTHLFPRIFWWRIFKEQSATAYNITFIVSDRVPRQIRHICMFAGRPAHSIHVSVSGTDLAWNDQRRDNTCRPNRGAAPIYFYVERRVRQAFVSEARHRARHPSGRGTLFLPVIPCPICRRIRKIPKLIYWKSCRVSRPFGSLDELSKRQYVIAFLCHLRPTRERMYESLASSCDF